jgi:hypothetical protein
LAIGKTQQQENMNNVQVIVILVLAQLNVLHVLLHGFYSIHNVPKMIKMDFGKIQLLVNMRNVPLAVMNVLTLQLV